jgi:hypothetical protein
VLAYDKKRICLTPCSAYEAAKEKSADTRATDIDRDLHAALGKASPLSVFSSLLEIKPI